MNPIAKLLMFIVTAGVMPVLSGLLPVSLLPGKKRRLPVIIMSGYLSTFALFELIGLPILLYTTYGDFRLLCVCFTIADAVWIAAGIMLSVRRGGLRLPRVLTWVLMRERQGKGRRRTGGEPETVDSLSVRKEDTGISREAPVFWMIFAALLLYELYKAYTTASFDGDDAYYAAQALQAWESGTMYYYVPYTGYTTPLDGRHALALMPMWAAYIAKFSGTHPAIIVHTLLPLVLIPAADVCFYCAACQLTREIDREKQENMLPAIMVILAVLQIFGNVSIYTTQTFLLMRTWQGKTLFANLILPGALALLAGKFRWDRQETSYYWVMLVILGIASGFCTSLAPALLTGFLVAASLVAAIVWRRWKLVPAMLAACFPNILYLVLLLRVSGIGFAIRLLPFLKGGRLP